MTDLLSTESITRTDLESIYHYVGKPIDLKDIGTVACSFQGTGTRTKTTFIQALRRLDLDFIELPVVLDTSEQIKDLAGYLDEYYDLYIIRYRDHRKLVDFTDFSKRPVINAMSSLEHPCEAISDAYWFDTTVRRLNGSRIVLWGPMTNVLRSWQNVAAAAGASVQVVTGATDLPISIDLVITDSWPDLQTEKKPSGLELTHMEAMGNPVLIPTPPFTVGKEILFHPASYDHFAGYDQKTCLLDVQEAIICWALELDNV